MSIDKTRQLQEKTFKLLKSIEAGHLTFKDIDQLREVLRFHEYRYYIQNDPLISDFEYDTLYKQLEGLEKENPDLIVPYSPTTYQAIVFIQQ